MRKVFVTGIFLLVLALFLSIISCSGMPMSSPGRQLQSITVTPMSADARNFPSGMVQFTAMGHFNMAPMTAATPVTWSLGNSTSTQPAPEGVSIDPMSGVARCSGFMGTVAVMATGSTGTNVTMSSMGGMATNVVGSAQLICP